MRAFDHVSVDTVQAAVSALADAGGPSALIAGGADLLSLMKAGIASPTTLIDLKSARALRGIELHDSGAVRLGALTTLADIERDEALAERLPVLRAAVLDAATPQIRNVATVGGNVMQRTRCWYFRGPYTCWQKGGATCYARGGQNKYHAIFELSPCVSAHPSDLAPALLALDAVVETQGTGGSRHIALGEFFQPPEEGRRVETTLLPAEVITAIEIPPQPQGARAMYLKMMDRRAWAYALTSAAAQLALTDGVVTHARVVLGAVANIPYRAKAVEAHLTGKPFTPELAKEAAALAIQDARPLTHNEYKVTLAQELTRRALLLAAGMEW
ncbi:MAG TPA: FAD binding domain-containing protein [Ktedonobacterales bacterium]